ncbi:MAG: hypothetical protein R3B97_14270 [Dehalococcoidia bacterium]|nr:hypothetical protein [Thermoflexaceae bacterium]
MNQRTPRIPFSLQDGEVVLLLVRRHWAYLTWGMFKLAVAALLPIALLLTVVSLTAGLGGRAGQVAGLLSAAWFVFWAVRSYFSWFRYNNDIWVITDQRIVDSTKRHWFHHSMASADLDDVEDIAIRKEGLFATAFNFGNVHLQTAGEQANFVLSGIPKPGDVLALIDKQRDVAKRRLRGPLPDVPV